MFKRLPIPFRFIVATGVVLGLVMGFKSLIPYMYWGDTSEYEWYRSALPHITNYLFWPLLVPLIYWTFEKFRMARGASIWDRFMNLFMSLVIPFIHESVTTIIYFLILQSMDKYDFDDEAWKVVKSAFPSVYIGRIVEYWIIYGLFAAFDYYKKYKNKQAEVGRIEAKLNRTKFEVLKMQLQPHFLFNALNSISSLMDVDVKKAQTVTARLGDLLRGILEQDERMFIPLEEELNYVKTYLEIEKIRFEDRLDIAYNIDEDVFHAEVPMLIIQPLVENAIKHGIAKMSTPGLIEVSVSKHNGEGFKIRVADNGPGQRENNGSLFTNGVGLSNLRARLSQLYQDQFKLTINTGDGKGFEVIIEIPKRTYHEKYQNDHS